MRTTQLRYFAAVTRSKSLRQAAETLYVSESALSKQIKSLEEELGFVLLSRGPTGVCLTVHGEVFLDFAEKVLVEYDAVLTRLERYDRASRFRIRLGSIPALTAYNLGEMLTSFQSEHLGIQIDLREETHVRLVCLMETNQADVLFTRTDLLPPETHACVPLIRDEFAIICSDQHRLAHLRSVPIEALSAERFVMLDDQCAIQGPFLSECRQHGITLNIVHEYSHHDFLLAAVNNDIGITALPRRAIMRNLETQAISAIPLHRPVHVEIGFVWQKNRGLSPWADDLVAFCRNAFTVDGSP